MSDPGKLHGMGVVWGDYDGDGWPDLYVTNDFGRTFLYHNRKNGTFEEVGSPTGTAQGPDGQSFGNMAGAFADFDRDGKLDLFVTRADNQPASLYWNQGEYFEDIARKAGIAGPTLAPVKWGIGFGDFDNDGWPDILVANGAFRWRWATRAKEVRFAEAIQLFKNRGNLTFEEIADEAGLNSDRLYSRRGTAFGDINNDGKLGCSDFHADAPPSSVPERDKERQSPRASPADRNKKQPSGDRRTRDRDYTENEADRRGSGGGSYNSTNDTRLHFGLGNDATMKQVEVIWPSGMRQEFRDIPGDTIYEIKEGEPIRKIKLLPALSRRVVGPRDHQTGQRGAAGNTAELSAPDTGSFTATSQLIGGGR